MENYIERWGVFSVIDHKDPLKLATDLLLYDKIAVPTPMDLHGEDWKRWQGNNWEPDKLMAMIERLKPKGLVIETEWDLDRQKNWRKAFEEVKAGIDEVNAKIRTERDKRIADAKAAMRGRSNAERDIAIQAAAFWLTRNEIIRHLKGEIPMYYGPVEFYAAYQSREDFEQLHPDEPALKQGIEQANFLIQHRLAVPDEPPDRLLDRVLDLVITPKYKDRRREFYQWQKELVQGGHKPEQILKALGQAVRDFNAQAHDHKMKCRWETVITVLTVSGAALTGWSGFDPESLRRITNVADAPLYASLIGSINNAGLAVWRKVLASKQVDAPQRIAKSGAMFRQIEGDTGFEFRTCRHDQAAWRPTKF